MNATLNTLHGGIFINVSNLNKDIPKRIRYDRDAFYPTEFLNLTKAPNGETLKEITLKEAKVVDCSIIKFDIMAIRKEQAWGLFFNRQREIIREKDIYMFYEEFSEVTEKEFDILKLENVQYFKPSVYDIPEKMHNHMVHRLEKKNKLKAIKYRTDEENKQLEEAKKQTIMPFVATIKEPIETFDRVSFSYLQSVCRVQMYKVAKKYKSIVKEVFVDSITLGCEQKEFTKENGWKIEKITKDRKSLTEEQKERQKFLNKKTYYIRQAKRLLISETCIVEITKRIQNCNSIEEIGLIKNFFSNLRTARNPNSPRSLIKRKNSEIIDFIGFKIYKQESLEYDYEMQLLRDEVE